MYGVLFSKKAEKELNAIPAPMRQRIAGKVKRLAADPDDKALNVKVLKGGLGYRLRIGNDRVLYTRDDAIRVLAVHRVADRRDAYR